MASIKFDFCSAAVTRIIHMNAFIPFDPPAPQMFEGPYKTLYLLTGFADNSDRVAEDSVIKRFSDETGIAVFVIDGNNSFYIDRDPLTRYSTLVGEEIIEVTRKVFPLSHRREDTFIGGMSMGGFGAFYNGVRYTDTFSKVVMLCPAFDVYDMLNPGTDIRAIPDSFLDLLFQSRENYEKSYNFQGVIETAIREKTELPELFLGMGDIDDLVDKGVSHFCSYMDEKGLELEKHIVPGGHDFIFMNNIFPYAFSFLFKEEVS